METKVPTLANTLGDALTSSALDFLHDLADQTDRTAYEAARAHGRQLGESALDFELRCIEEGQQ